MREGSVWLNDARVILRNLSYMGIDLKIKELLCAGPDIMDGSAGPKLSPLKMHWGKGDQWETNQYLLIFILLIKIWWQLFFHDIMSVRFCGESCIWICLQHFSLLVSCTVIKEMKKKNTCEANKLPSKPQNFLWRLINYSFKTQRNRIKFHIKNWAFVCNRSKNLFDLLAVQFSRLLHNFVFVLLRLVIVYKL